MYLKIGLTGVPVMGKTYLIKNIVSYLKEFNNEVVYLPETARYVIELFNDTKVIENKELFQITVLSSIFSQEKLLEEKYFYRTNFCVDDNKNTIIVCDRVFLDGFIFSTIRNLDFNFLLKTFNNMNISLKKYDLIINLSISDNEAGIEEYFERFGLQVYDLIQRDIHRKQTLDLDLNKYKKFVKQFYEIQKIWLTLYQLKNPETEIIDYNLIDFAVKNNDLFETFRRRNEKILFDLKEFLFRKTSEEKDEKSNE